MLYLALGAAVLGLLLWASRSPAVRFGSGLKALTGLVALVAVVVAIISLLRGAWGVGLALLAMGIALAATLRTTPRSREPGERGHRPARSARMTRAEAAELLGVSPDAGRDEVQAAYVRLMRMAHPDSGGTHGLAAKLNQARETLLG